MGRGHLCWTKRISVNEWCLISSMFVLIGGTGGSRQPRRGRQAMLVMVLYMYVIVYGGDMEVDRKEFDTFQCVIASSVFPGHFVQQHIKSALVFLIKTTTPI